MEYAIQTLEIEIARIRKDLRIAESVTLSYEDVRSSAGPNYADLRYHISELEIAIGILKQWEKDHYNDL